MGKPHCKLISCVLRPLARLASSPASFTRSRLSCLPYPFPPFQERCPPRFKHRVSLDLSVLDPLPKPPSFFEFYPYKVLLVAPVECRGLPFFSLSNLFSHISHWRPTSSIPIPPRGYPPPMARSISRDLGLKFPHKSFPTPP